MSAAGRRRGALCSQRPVADRSLREYSRVAGLRLSMQRYRMITVSARRAGALAREAHMWYSRHVCLSYSVERAIVSSKVLASVAWRLSGIKRFAIHKDRGSKVSTRASLTTPAVLCILARSAIGTTG